MGTESGVWVWRVPPVRRGTRATDETQCRLDGIHGQGRSAKDFKGLALWLQEAIIKDIQDSMAPPKPQAQSVGFEADLFDKKQASTSWLLRGVGIVANQCVACGTTTDVRECGRMRCTLA